MKGFAVKRLLPLFALLAASPAPLAPDLVQLGASDIAKATGVDIVTRVDSNIASFSYNGEMLLVAPTMLSLVQNRQEARAFAAIALAYGKALQFQAGRKKAGIVETVVAFPMAMAAQNRAKNFRTEPNGPTPQDVDEARANAGHDRAALAIQLAQMAGSCSGPMVDLLTRMRKQDVTGNAAAKDSPSGLARRVIADLGRTVYPPDRSCIL